MSRRIGLLSVLLGMLAVFAFAQDPERGPRGQRGRRGGEAGQQAGQGREERRPGFDPAQLRERMMTNMKEQLGASDAEWETLRPKVMKVWTLHRDLRPGMAGMAGMAGRPRQGGAREENEVAKAQRELRTTLQNKDAPTEEIQKQLTALRNAREKVRKDLEAAQKDLKASVNPRQEAVLVLNGLLD